MLLEQISWEYDTLNYAPYYLLLFFLLQQKQAKKRREKKCFPSYSTQLLLTFFSLNVLGWLQKIKELNSKARK